jgi:hypothetical protein
MHHEDFLQQLDAYLNDHPKAALRLIEEKFGLSIEEIETILREAEYASLKEFQENRRLIQAFNQIVARGTAINAPQESRRRLPRRIIPRTTVQYCIRHCWFGKKSFSSAWPVIDLNSRGISFLADESLKPGKRISLLLMLPNQAKAIHIDGRTIYAIATGIAGYRYRIGTKFVRFSFKYGYRKPVTLEIFDEFENE